MGQFIPWPFEGRRVVGDGSLLPNGETEASFTSSIDGGSMIVAMSLDARRTDVFSKLGAPGRSSGCDNSAPSA